MTGKQDWTTFNSKTNHFVCSRCGATEFLKLPMELRKAAKRAIDFADNHILCEEPK